MILKNSTYDRYKFLALHVLPAVGTLYFAVAAIWGLPYAEEVVGTITAVVAFLALVLKASEKGYATTDQDVDGSIDVTETETGKNFMLNLNADPDQLKAGQKVTFKVNGY